MGRIQIPYIAIPITIPCDNYAYTRTRAQHPASTRVTSRVSRSTDAAAPARRARPGNEASQARVRPRDPAAGSRYGTGIRGMYERAARLTFVLYTKLRICELASSVCCW